MSDTAAKVAELGYVSMKFCPLSKLSVSSVSRGIHPAIKEDAKYISFNGRSTHFYFLAPKSKSFKKKKVAQQTRRIFHVRKTILGRGFNGHIFLLYIC